MSSTRRSTWNSTTVGETCSFSWHPLVLGFSRLIGAIPDAIPDALLATGFNVAITIGQSTLCVVPDLI